LLRFLALVLTTLLTLAVFTALPSCNLTYTISFSIVTPNFAKIDEEQHCENKKAPWLISPEYRGARSIAKTVLNKV